MLYEFLLKNQEEVLAMTEKKSLELAGVRPSSDQLKRGLPIFYEQLLTVLKEEIRSPRGDLKKEKGRMAQAATDNNEEAMVDASGRPGEAGLAKSAGSHGKELLRLGYTLSHVVHAYGSMCQSITELATKKEIRITPDEFHDLNRCLDVAIAGAVTEYQALRNTEVSSREVEHLGFLAHELRNALGTVTMSLGLIKDGTVGFGGNVGQVLDRGLKLIAQLIDNSLTEVRLRVDPVVHIESINLLELIDQIILTAGIEAQSKKLSLETQVDPDLLFKADRQLIHSAMSNLIQNAIKYTHDGGKIILRGKSVDGNVVTEVEDECGGLTDSKVDLFKPFVQQNENRKGLGLGLTIAHRAVMLNHGTIDVSNILGKGCIFKITLPK
ncbi:MAG: HAMP domain-containing histidine kinase [Bdellovibrionales bacterium]|nr:HAMP domain-containing histidine kinase [Bdellovibrionales bacterium]